MKKSVPVKDIVFRIFNTLCIVLSVYVFALLRKLSGEPVTKMWTDILIIVLLVTLNITVLALYEKVRSSRK